MERNIKQTSQWCLFNVFMIAFNFEKVSGLFITHSEAGEMLRRAIWG